MNGAMIQMLMKVFKGKYSRYASFVLAGVLLGSWLSNQYPQQTASFWAQPLVALALTILATVSGQAATKDWKAKVHEALMTEPPKA